MVKGVNRQIIEINDTGNRFFERVLLFVSPEGAELGSRELGKEAREFLLHLTPETAPKQGLRSRIARRKVKRRLILGGAACAVLFSTVFIVINFL